MKRMTKVKGMQVFSAHIATSGRITIAIILARNLEEATKTADDFVAQEYPQSNALVESITPTYLISSNTHNDL